LAFAVALAAPSDERSGRIVGGVAALPGEFPFSVSLQWVLIGVSTHVCGGVILNNIWVLSAAHCFTDTPTIGSLVILAGRHNLGATEPGQVSHAVDRARSVIHHGWGGGGVGPDDLVLIRLVLPITFTDRIRPARLPQSGVIPTGTGILSGWGSTGGSGSSNILQKAILSKIENLVCRQAIFDLNLNGNLVDDTNFCTGPLTGGLSACSGDSGSGMIQGASPNEVVTGIVSWGITPCGTRGAPSGVFKQVSLYIGWIFENTGISPS